jgi:hypothetical protein
VNFLNFRKNTKKASLAQLATAKAIRCDGVAGVTAAFIDQNQKV